MNEFIKVDSRVILQLFKQKLFLAISFVFVCCGSSNAYYDNWVEGGSGQMDGASRYCYNLGAKLAWKNFMGDWVDTTGMPQGLSPYSQAFIKDTDSVQKIEWDVTDLVKEWLNGTYLNNGMFLHAVAGKGSYKFRSREYSGNQDQRPKLKIAFDNGTQVLIEPEADTYICPATFKSIGGKSEFLFLRSQPNVKNILIRFPLDCFSGEKISKARLELTTFAQYGSKILIGVFRCVQGNSFPSVKKYGVAKHYDNDLGIGNHDDVIFATGFEKRKWLKEWSAAIDNYEVVSSDSKSKFSPFLGRALRLRLPKGSNMGGKLRYVFKERTGSEPEKIFFRYYLRFGDNWNQSVSGGKLPGFRGTYNKAGWGGRKPNGFDGWSARGSFLPAVHEKNNPLFGMTPIGFYCYYADQPKQYGDSWTWNPGENGFPVRNRWYCIEQYVELNTPGVKNGILKAWVDGYKVFEKKDILFRLSYDLKIEEVVLTLFHGGKAVSPYEQDMYIDNVVIAESYIGPANLSRSDTGKGN